MNLLSLFQILYALYGLTCVGFCVQAGSIIDHLVEEPSSSYSAYKWPLGLAGMAVLVLTYYSVAQASMDLLIFHTVACLAAMVGRFTQLLDEDGKKETQENDESKVVGRRLVEQTLGVVAFINERYVGKGKGSAVSPIQEEDEEDMEKKKDECCCSNPPPPSSPLPPTPTPTPTPGPRFIDGIGIVESPKETSSFVEDSSMDELLEVGFRLKDMFRLANAGFSPFVVVMFISSGAASTIGFFTSVVGVSLLFGQQSSTNNTSLEDSGDCQEDFSSRDRVFYLQSLASIDSLFLGVASLLRLYYMTNVGQRLRGAVRKVKKVSEVILCVVLSLTFPNLRVAAALRPSSLSAMTS